MNRDQWAAQEAARIRDNGRMLKWLRRQMNRDLRAARARRDADGIAKCKALLDLLRSAENWQGTYGDPTYANVVMDANLVLAFVRKIAVGYRLREGWRDEWLPR